MKLTLATLLAIVLIIALGKCAGATECHGSAREVWAQAPHAHATWNLIAGKQCWRAGRPTSRHAARRLVAYGMVVLRVPLPRPRRDFEIIDPARYPRLDPKAGQALAEELFGRF